MNNIRLTATATLTAMTLIASGCTVPSRNVSAAQPVMARATEIARPGPSLEPGCPLGSVSVQGLNPVQQGCGANSRLVPPGPVGLPNLD